MQKEQVTNVTGSCLLFFLILRFYVFFVLVSAFLSYCFFYSFGLIAFFGIATFRMMAMRHAETMPDSPKISCTR